ncbi:Variable major protein (plasmid) [Borrelia crocidurae DOU]|uniref:Variable large protein n=1 Tax=Borrelia crocidurae DOU TaxID=1293575 RepID=W5SM28_9SPIR|nr:variable large family protein [Borrelia crocidurae]AHH07900.1 Variable major protein [Borrelia crocidurae DOU]
MLEDLRVKADIKSTDKRGKIKEYCKKVKSQYGIGIGVETNADFVIAVALKAMSKDGKFWVDGKKAGSDDDNKVKEASDEAVNKILDTLGLIIIRTVRMEIGKVNSNVNKVIE